MSDDMQDVSKNSKKMPFKKGSKKKGGKGKGGMKKGSKSAAC